MWGASTGRAGAFLEDGKKEWKEATDKGEGCPGRVGLATQQNLSPLDSACLPLAWREIKKPEMPGMAVALAVVAVCACMRVCVYACVHACVSVQDLVSAKGFSDTKGQAREN